jgi:catechol 2,3-dioxygenase
MNLPNDVHVGQVHLQVSDLERSRSFYEGVIGFRVVDESSWQLALGVDDYPLVILQGGATRARRVRHLGLYHYAILVPDRATLGRVIPHLLDMGINPGAADHLVSEAIYLQDPDDHGIEIYRDRARSEWRHNGNEIAMATDPLDFEAVIAAGEGAQWEGMPPGTVIGHVHFHVGDLEAARSFYHQALGLDVVVSSYPGALFLSAGGYHHHVGLNTWAGPTAQPPGPGEPKLDYWDLVLPSEGSVGRVAANLRHTGHEVIEQNGYLFAADPWGTRVRLVVAGQV